MPNPLTNPTNKVNGTLFPQIQPGRCGRTEAGTYTDIPYETTSYIEALRIALDCEINGLCYDWEQTFGKQKITIHYPYNWVANTPANEPPVDLWEMNSQRAEKDILDVSNPNLIGLPAGWIYYLRLFQQNPADYTITLQTTFNMNPVDPTGYPLTGTPWFSDGTAIAAPYILPAFQLPFPSTSAGATLAALISFGMTSQPIFVPELKHTQTVNSQYPLQANFLNVGAIISTATLNLIESIPNNLLFTLPNTLNPATGQNMPTLVYGWYKNAPQVNQISRLKWQLVNSWQYGLWPTAVYGYAL